MIECMRHVSIFPDGTDESENAKVVIPNDDSENTEAAAAKENMLKEFGTKPLQCILKKSKIFPLNGRIITYFEVPEFPDSEDFTKICKYSGVKKTEKKKVDGDEFYYTEYNNGMCSYGMYDAKGKWWSTRTEVINEVFGTDFTEVTIDTHHYGILASVLESCNSIDFVEEIVMNGFPNNQDKNTGDLDGSPLNPKYFKIDAKDTATDEIERYIVLATQNHVNLFGQVVGDFMIMDIRYAINEEYSNLTINEQFQHFVTAFKLRCERCGEEYWVICKSVNVEDFIPGTCPECKGKAVWHTYLN